jgi:hypothetical protein
MTPTPAPMTAGEAATAFAEFFLTRAPRWDSVANLAHEWFSTHWPAGGAVTGEELYEAASAAAPSSHHGNWDWIREDVQAQWNDAAARLSAPPVAFDHDAVAEEICRAVYVNDFQTEKVAAILRRHAAAPAAGVRTYTVQDLHTYYEKGLKEGAECARAGTAGQTTDVHETMAQYAIALQRLIEHHAKGLPIPASVLAQTRHHADMLATTGAQWVQRPAGQASSIKTPRECGVHAESMVVVEHRAIRPSFMNAEQISDYMSENTQHDVVRWCVPGQPFVDRTPATAGGWTGRDVPSGHLAYQRLFSSKWYTLDAACLNRAAMAEVLNREDVRAVYVLPTPPVEAQS